MLTDARVTDRIVKALGEGGFSFVYLAQDEVTGVSYSLALVLGLETETPCRHPMS
jgi:serine/threonine protein kinase